MIFAMQIPSVNISNGKIMIEIIYIISFAVVMSFFRKLLYQEYQRDPGWIALFGFAFLLKNLAIFADFIFHNRLEDYIELFALYFFAAAFLLSLKKRKKK
jgi:RsiW-degrading membrane proteinase PrsW (M82 family)